MDVDLDIPEQSSALECDYATHSLNTAGFVVNEAINLSYAKYY